MNKCLTYQVCPDVASLGVEAEDGPEALLEGVELGPVSELEVLVVLHPVGQPAEGLVLEVPRPPHNLLRHGLGNLNALFKTISLFNIRHFFGKALRIQVL